MMLCKARLALRETLVNLAHDSDKVSNISLFKENHFHFKFKLEMKMICNHALHHFHFTCNVRHDV